MTNLIRLRRDQQFKDIEAAIRAYLRNREAKNPAPWLYEMLAAATEINGGKAQDVETFLGYAADQAMKSALLVDLTRVADELAMRKMYDRAGVLLDAAMAKNPAAAQPIWMSIALSGKAQDPKRMAESLEKLLSLGWPGIDDAWRAFARKQAEELAKALREGGREDEAQILLDRLPAAEARDLVLRLTWSGDADLDLAVEEPLGATARVATPRTVFGGAIVKNGYGNHPEEVYVCPRAFNGDYKVRVDMIYNDETNPAHDVTLEIITHEGTEQERSRTETIAIEGREPMVVPLEGGRRTTVLPFQAEPEIEPPAPPPTRRPTLTTPTPADAADALRAPAAPKPR
jgi:hypothetical protein